MASAAVAASRGRTLASLVGKLLADPSVSASPVSYLAPRSAAAAAATAARRMYNTELRRYENDDGESSDDSGAEYDSSANDRLRARDLAAPGFFSADVLDRFGAPTSLGRLLALMEDAAATPGTASAAAASRGGWWVAKEDDDAVYLKMPMPGLGKEHVKVWADQNILVVKGEGDKDPEDDAEAAPPRYSRRIEVAPDAFKMDKIKAEMKNGVLRVTVPKVKDEERKDVFQVMVE